MSTKQRKTELQRRKTQPRCIVIAGPNGAGKTAFARRYLPEGAGVVHFVNADLIASGLSPLKPELAAIAAARMVLREIDRLASERLDFAFETTLSGLIYGRRLQYWRKDREVYDAEKEAGQFCNGCWPCIATRREGRAEDSTYVRNTALRMGERQDRRQQAVMS